MPTNRRTWWTWCFPFHTCAYVNQACYLSYRVDWYFLFNANFSYQIYLKILICCFPFLSWFSLSIKIYLQLQLQLQTQVVLLLIYWWVINQLPSCRTGDGGSAEYFPRKTSYFLWNIMYIDIDNWLCYACTLPFSLQRITLDR